MGNELATQLHPNHHHQQSINPHIIKQPSSQPTSFSRIKQTKFTRGDNLHGKVIFATPISESIPTENNYYYAHTHQPINQIRRIQPITTSNDQQNKIENSQINESQKDHKMMGNTPEKRQNSAYTSPIVVPVTNRISRLMRNDSSIQNLRNSSASHSSNLRTSSVNHSSSVSTRKQQILEAKVRELIKQTEQSRGQIFYKERKNAQLERTLFELRTQLNGNNSQFQLLSNRLTDSARRQIDKNNRINQLQSQKVKTNEMIYRLQNELKYLNGEMEGKQKVIHSLEQALFKRNQTISQMDGRICSLLKQVAQKQSEVNQGKTSLHQIMMENKALNDNFEGIQNHKVILNKRIEELQQEINAYKVTIETKNAGIFSMQEQLNHKNQFIINLQVHITEKEQEINNIKTEYEKLHAKFTSARDVGQEQIDYLTRQLKDVQNQNQNLTQEVQLARIVSIERNKLFERKVIYDLKSQNDQLWEKLIQISEKEAQKISSESGYWENKVKDHKQRRNKSLDIRKSNIKKQEEKFNKFIQTLQKQEELYKSAINQQTQNKLKKSYENTEFFKQKCGQLQKLVASNLEINRNLRQQLQAQKQKNGQRVIKQNQLVIKQNLFLKTEMAELKKYNDEVFRNLMVLKDDYSKKIDKMQQKIRQLQDQHAQSELLHKQNTSMKYQLQSEIHRLISLTKKQQNQIKILTQNEESHNRIKRKMEGMNQYEQLFKKAQKQLAQVRKKYSQKVTLYEIMINQNQVLSQRLETSRQKYIEYSGILQQISQQFSKTRRQSERIYGELTRCLKALQSYYEDNAKYFEKEESMLYQIDVLKNNYSKIFTFYAQLVKTWAEKDLKIKAVLIGNSTPHQENSISMEELSPVKI